MTDEWQGFLQGADEWLINYLSAPDWLAESLVMQPERHRQDSVD